MALMLVVLEVPIPVPHRFSNTHPNSTLQVPFAPFDVQRGHCRLGQARDAGRSGSALEAERGGRSADRLQRLPTGGGVGRFAEEYELVGQVFETYHYVEGKGWGEGTF